MTGINDLGLVIATLIFLAIPAPARSSCSPDGGAERRAEGGILDATLDGRAMACGWCWRCRRRGVGRRPTRARLTRCALRRCGVSGVDRFHADPQCEADAGRGQGGDG